MLSRQLHRWIFLFGTFSLFFGMMVGTVPTSVPQFILLGNWLLELDFARKWRDLKHNKVFWLMSGIFLIHVAGLLHTSDLVAGWNDVRTKIPLMFLPLIFMSTAPLEKKEGILALVFFLGGCLANTIWCLLYSFVLHEQEVVRNASRFMSHIRLGLYLNVAICVCVYFLARSEKFSSRVLLTLLVVYFVVVMYVLGLMTGLSNLLVLAVLFLLFATFRMRGLWRWAGFTALTVVVGVSMIYLYRIASEQINVSENPNNKLLDSTAWGRVYSHFDTLGQKENGNYVLINLQLEELQREWNRVAPEDAFTYEPAHNLERYEVLVRYLSSLGHTKDSATVHNLTEHDRINIKAGITNHRYPGWSFFRQRVYELVNEFDEFRAGRHVNGHSLSMRLYFWQAGLACVRDHPIVGVGTGDVQPAMNNKYISTGSPLEKEWYKRPHNQFLTVTVALGITGLLVFLFCLFTPPWLLRTYVSPVYWPFLVTVILSFMLEDTIETQAGASFFAVFSSFFLSEAYFRKQQTPVD